MTVRLYLSAGLLPVCAATPPCKAAYGLEGTDLHLKIIFCYILHVRTHCDLCEMELG